MKTPVNIVIFSHLSDAQEEIRIGMTSEQTIRKINFVKFLLLHHGYTNTPIDADKVWKRFMDADKVWKRIMEEQVKK